MDGTPDTDPAVYTDLERERERASALDTDALADAIEAVGFDCTRCGACCTAHGEEGNLEPHTATVFPDEADELRATTEREWHDVVRPIPYGLTEGDDGLEGETFEWSLQTDGCGDCVFYTNDDGTGACTVHADRPLICQTYPFSIALEGTSQPMGDPIDHPTTHDESRLRVHECEGLGREISRADAESLAETLKHRAIREIEETIAVSERYEPANPDSGEVVVHDSEGPKHPDGTPL